MEKLRTTDSPAGYSEFLTAVLACLTRGIVVTLLNRSNIRQQGGANAPPPQKLCVF